MKHTTPLLALVLALSACPADEKDEPVDTDETDAVDTDETNETDETDLPTTDCAVTPGAWSAPDWETNAAEALALRAALDTLVNTARGAEDGTAADPIDDVADLVALYEAGDPSVASITTSAFDAITRDAFAEFVEVIEAGGKDLVDDTFEFTPGEAGGIFGPSFRGINEGGIEVRQIVDKGLFGGGAFYPWALSLTEGTITPATVDALAAIFGADPNLDAAVVTDSANYANRMQLFTPAAAALTAAKAYAGSAACAAERDAALVDFFRTWEIALVARTVYYANAASELLQAPGGDADVADALHQIAEGYGLAAGLYGIQHPTAGPLAGAGRVITDAQVETALQALGVDLSDLGASTAGAFVSDPEALVEGVTTFEGVVKQAYGVDDAQIAAWRPAL